MHISEGILNTSQYKLGREMFKANRVVLQQRVIQIHQLDMHFTQPNKYAKCCTEIDSLVSGDFVFAVAFYKCMLQKERYDKL